MYRQHLAMALLAACGMTTEAAPSLEGRVVSVAPMRVSRAAHSATLLPNGMVLIAGGFGGGASGFATTEFYDPAAGRFAPGPSMSAARAGHTATLLPDGLVLMAGGFNGEYLQTAELYDPSSGSFRPTGAMTMPRSGHIAVLLPSGKVLLAGGVGTGWSFLASAELYDPATARFTATGAMAVARESHTASLLPDGRVLIAGGHRDRRSAITIYSSAELYDPATGRFLPTGAMRLRRHKHDAVTLPDGSVLVLGGADERDDRGTYRSVERFDPASGRFSDAGEMRSARYKFQGSSVVLRNGTILLVGGSAVTEVYDPAAREFRIIPQGVGVTRLFAATTLLSDGAVLIAGGYGSDVSASAQAWVYMPQD